MTNEALDATLREAYGRVVYTHKTHEKMIDQLSSTANWCQLGKIVLLSLTTAGVISTILEGTIWLKIGTAIISAVSLAVAVYQWSFNPERNIEQHRRTAASLWGIREEYANLIADIQDGSISDDEARQVRDGLTRRLEEIYSDAPPTNPKAYEQASRGLKQGEEMTFSTEEVDRFLPQALRRKAKQP